MADPYQFDPNNLGMVGIAPSSPSSSSSGGSMGDFKKIEYGETDRSPSPTPSSRQVGGVSKKASSGSGSSGGGSSGASRGGTYESNNGGDYVVQAGDTLGKIARDHGMSVDELAEMNGITNPDYIQAGWTLNVGGSGGEDESEDDGGDEGGWSGDEDESDDGGDGRRSYRADDSGDESSEDDEDDETYAGDEEDTGEGFRNQRRAYSGLREDIENDNDETSPASGGGSEQDGEEDGSVAGVNGQDQGNDEENTGRGHGWFGFGRGRRRRRHGDGRGHHHHDEEENGDEALATRSEGRGRRWGRRDNEEQAPVGGNNGDVSQDSAVAYSTNVPSSTEPDTPVNTAIPASYKPIDTAGPVGETVSDSALPAVNPSSNTRDSRYTSGGGAVTGDPDNASATEPVDTVTMTTGS